ncbi:MAG: hypothetical protein IJ833_00625 [Lachnospiraceae bacterium]|nr:hypothetical protein [Lachnospiraceae bacterium]
MKSNVQIIKDDAGHKIAVLPEVIFKNKQNIDWGAVEEYLQRYVGEFVDVADTESIVYIGTDFPSEYKGSKYTKRLKGSYAKAKANAAQGITSMLEIATQKGFSENREKKHARDAKNGWYYYTTRFALPVYENEMKTENYNVYLACLLVNRTKFGKMYLYDLVDIKREASTPLRTMK